MPHRTTRPRTIDDLLIKDSVYSDSSMDRLAIDSYYSHFLTSLRNALVHQNASGAHFGGNGKIEKLPERK